MNMVRRPADGESLDSMIASDTAKVIPKARLRRLGNELCAFLRGEYDMKNCADVTVHRVSPLNGLLLDNIVCRPSAAALG